LQTIKLQPAYYQAYFQVGLINQKYRNHYAALANYQKVQQLRPQFPRIDTYIGYCHEQMGQYEQAVAAYTKATRQNPADRQAAAGLWRSQRRQYAGSYNPLFLPNTPAEPVTVEQKRTELDTSRVRISTIQPKARVSVSESDSLRRAVKPIGQN
jgi:tetratricopeptide (TPR) repeat protein